MPEPRAPFEQLAAFSGSSDHASARLASIRDAAGTRWILKQWRDPERNQTNLDRREQLPAAVARSPQLVTGVRCTWKGSDWLAQPWIDGVNMLARIRVGPPRMVERCIDAGFDFADQLHNAESANLGVVHYDLAPSNVLWTGKSAYLTDFEHWNLAPTWHNHVDVLLSFGSAANNRGIRPRGRSGAAAFCEGPWNRMGQMVLDRFARVAPALDVPMSTPAEISDCIGEVIEQKALRQLGESGPGAFSASWRETANEVGTNGILPLAQAVAESVRG